MQKNVFFAFANYLRFWYWHTYPGYRHVKAHENVNKFLGVGVFERELLLLKLRRLQNFRSGHNIEFSEPKRIFNFTHSVQDYRQCMILHTVCNSTHNV